MFDFFEKVLGFFDTIFNFFINLIESYLMAINVVAESIRLPIFLSGFLPAFLGAALLIVISLSVIKLIVGR